jgi:hypothetical protein
VDGRVPVLLDGGVRRGSDVFKALALGAAAGACGAPHLAGAAVAGGGGRVDVLSQCWTSWTALWGLVVMSRADLGASGLLVPAQIAAARHRRRAHVRPPLPPINPMGLMGFEFVEFASPTPGLLEPLFERWASSLVARHRSKDVLLYRQGGINFIVNREPRSLAGYFAAEHGPSACAHGLPRAGLAPGLRPRAGARRAAGRRAHRADGAARCRPSRASAARRCT